MNLKSFFAVRFMGIAIIVAIAYYIIFVYGTTLITEAYQTPTLLLTGGLTTIGIMTLSYKQLRAGPKEEEFVHLDSEFDHEEYARLESLKLSGQLGDSEIGVVEARTPSAPPHTGNPHPKTPTKKDFDREIKNKLLQSIKNGNIDVKVVVERNGEGEWEITKAKSNIKTAKQPKTPKKPFIGRSQRSRG